MAAALLLLLATCTKKEEDKSVIQVSKQVELYMKVSISCLHIQRFSFCLRQNENSKLLLELIFCFQMSVYSFENRYIIHSENCDVFSFKGYTL